ncbi:CLUMA_CG015706, isoform A [Clunio marinus]|uniref:CLUMA_CG015706, isoform A n=1 Tax=Clunio marinus TaxID=568069 RepID=A0A1J1INV4_9DIPT|nr:CLUMA_CG015706, isoform A [Clunio marinus]
MLLLTYLQVFWNFNNKKGKETDESFILILLKSIEFFVDMSLGKQLTFGINIIHFNDIAFK